MVSDCLHVTPEYTDEGYPMVRVSEIGNNILNIDNALKVSEEDYAIYTSNYKPQRGDIVLARVGAFLGQFSFVDTDDEFCIGQNTTIIHPHKMNKYIYYNLISDLTQKRLQREAAGSAYKSVGVDTIKNFEIDIPDEHSAELLGSILYKIDRKIQINNGINDNLQQQMCLIFENLMAEAASNKISGRYIEAKELTQIITGKEDANFSTTNGQYKFFTCSNVPLQCDEYAFDSSSILIAGNGDFNVKHYSGKFNAYQWTYILTPDKDYYALLYLASLYRINSFKFNSSESIVKFITKGDVETIPVFVPNDKSYLHQLNFLMLLQEHNALESEQLIALRDWLLPMLMNGQVTISD